MEARIAILISVLSLFFAGLGYFRPKKPGGSSQWVIELDEQHKYVLVKQVGSVKARNVRISIDSAVPQDEIQKRFSYPNDVMTFPIYRTFGKPTVKITIKWKDVLRIRHKREFDI